MSRRLALTAPHRTDPSPKTARRHGELGSPAAGKIRIGLTNCPSPMATAVRRAVRQTLASHGIHSAELAIAFVSSATMRCLHGQWLGRDSVTDVLTFDLRNEVLPRGPKRMHYRENCFCSRSARVRPTVDGQIVICTQVAREEGRRRGRSWRAELVLYVIHGCLHLCGYDDRRPRQANRMRRAQAQLLSRLYAR